MAPPTECTATLPTHYYLDGEHYARELEAIWYRDWICLGRAAALEGAGDFAVHRIGDQEIILVRDSEGALRAFHNTCRHRGSVLCRTDSGRFRNQRIVCPYHAWTYGLDGELLATPRRLPAEDFDNARYPLYAVALAQWGGFVFVNLDPQPAVPIERAFGDEPEDLRNWPLGGLVPVHTESRLVACNWKLFWENFQECYHCPTGHPALCTLVQAYGRGILGQEDDPAWTPLVDPATGQAGPLFPGAVTWSADGRTDLPWFGDLTEAERRAGMTFATLLPSMFVVAHVDYVRSVRVLARAPEQTEIIVDWLVAPQARAAAEADLERLTGFARQVVNEDARLCEINQRGLHCRRHRAGVLVPQEYGVAEFDRWVLARLGRNQP